MKAHLVGEIQREYTRGDWGSPTKVVTNYILLGTCTTPSDKYVMPIQGTNKESEHTKYKSEAQELGRAWRGLENLGSASQGKVPLTSPPL